MDVIRGAGGLRCRPFDIFLPPLMFFNLKQQTEPNAYTRKKKKRLLFASVAERLELVTKYLSRKVWRVRSANGR
jgi:hypothetical protein